MTPCPGCGGQHLRDLVYQHRTSCRIYLADDATVAADHYNIAGTRRAQNHEKELINAQQQPDPRHLEPRDGEQYGIRYSHRGGVHQRHVVILDEHGAFLRDAQLEPAGDGGDDA